MNRACVIVADGKHARFFLAQPGASPRHAVELVETRALDNPDLVGARSNGAGRVETERPSSRQAGDTHPAEPRRQQRCLEIERRFGREIAREADALTSEWEEGAIIFIAEPRLLGLTRGYLRDAVRPALTLQELARNCTQLTASELREQLGLEAIAAGRRAPAR